MKRSLVPVVLGALVLTACGTGADDPEPDVLRAAPTPDGTPTSYPRSDYSYTLRVNCFCLDAGVPISVTVRDGEVVDAVFARRGRGHDAGEPAGRWQRLTIDDVIGAVDEARAQDAYQVHVRWPDGQDYPTSVWIDRDRDMADEEIGYEISDVTPA